MRRATMILGVAAIVTGMATTTFAGDFKLIISIGRAILAPPAPVVVYQPPPPPPQPVVVYQQPQVVYQQPQVVYQQPVVYRPLGVAVPPPVCRPMSGPAFEDRRHDDRDRGGIRSGHYVYEPVRRADGSVWYRQIWQN